MKYVLITHVPTYVGQSAGVVRLTDSFRDDLLAEAAALRDAGFTLTLATPRHAEPDAKSLSRERYADIRLADHGIADAPLPAYLTMPQFLAAQSKLKSAILSATKGAAVVQFGAGGHPMALGQFGWPLIDPATPKTKRVFVFAGDPLPGRRRAITSGHNPAKRLAKGLAVRTFDAFCREAVGEADLVFAHDPAVQKRFAWEWNAHCHTFFASPIGDADLAFVGATPASPAEGQLAFAGDAGVAPTKTLVRIFAEARKGSTAGLDHIEKAIAKAQRLGAKLALTVAPLNAAALDAADVFIAAPLVPGEISAIFLAAARGLPILCYGGGSVDAALADAGAAVRVERGDADRLAQALLDLSRDRTKLPAMSRAALDWAKQNTRDAVHRQRVALVRSLVGS